MGGREGRRERERDREVAMVVAMMATAVVAMIATVAVARMTTMMFGTISIITNGTTSSSPSSLSSPMAHLAAVILPLFGCSGGCSGHPTAYWMQWSSYRLKVEVAT